jgi:hypothetical protein
MRVANLALRASGTAAIDGIRERGCKRRLILNPVSDSEPETCCRTSELLLLHTSYGTEERKVLCSLDDAKTVYRNVWWWLLLGIPENDMRKTSCMQRGNKIYMQNSDHKISIIDTTWEAQT